MVVGWVVWGLGFLGVVSWVGVGVGAKVRELFKGPRTSSTCV